MVITISKESKLRFKEVTQFAARSQGWGLELRAAVAARVSSRCPGLSPGLRFLWSARCPRDIAPVREDARLNKDLLPAGSQARNFAFHDTQSSM